MATAGQTFENPVTGEKMVFVKTGRETNGMVLEIEFFIQPNSGKGLSAHVHPYYAERFELIAGSAHYKLANAELSTQANDILMLPIGVAHVHPWNVGNDVLHVRKITQLNKPDMQLLLASATFFESLYALAQQGKVGKDGLPKDLLQTIVLLQAFCLGSVLWLSSRGDYRKSSQSITPLPNLLHQWNEHMVQCQWTTKTSLHTRCVLLYLV